YGDGDARFPRSGILDVFLEKPLGNPDGNRGEAGGGDTAARQTEHGRRVVRLRRVFRILVENAVRGHESVLDLEGLATAAGETHHMPVVDHGDVAFRHQHRAELALVAAM